MRTDRDTTPGWHRVPRILGILVALCCADFQFATLFAQVPRPERARHESLLLEIDVAATKKFATIQNHLRVGQLPEAIDLLRNQNEGQAGKLVAAGPGRYVKPTVYASMLSAALSPEGLKVYRAQFDPLLRPTYEAGRDNLDEQKLLKVIEQGYCCTFADDALLLLGDLAWDEGDLWRARSYWEQLLPPLQPKELGEPVLLPGYPDSDLDRSLVYTRLALCGLETGRFEAVRRIIARLEESHPEAVGQIAGQTGNLGKLLQTLLQQKENHPSKLQSPGFETFGGQVKRFNHVPSMTDFGTVRWQTRLRALGGEPRRGFIPGGAGLPCYFPVIYGDLLLVQDSEDIYAYRLDTGAPVWPAEDGSARIFSASDLAPGAIRRGLGDRALSNIGVPRLTMTVADGRLYARMGSISPFGSDRGGILVCLDLAHREGSLIWSVFASEIEADDTDWTMEGSPLVIGNRVYIGLRKSNPQPQANVACFDAGTGKLLWNRRLCVGSANPNIPDFDVNQHLLTWGDGTLYYATHMGAVAALEPHSGATKWLVTYPRIEDPKFRHELEARLRRGPLPAMFADGTVYVAPLDSDDLIAIDAETGVVKWSRSFQSPIQSLLGVGRGNVYVSGAQLWAVSTQSGRIVWPQPGEREPEAAGFGRGLMVGDSIFWPNHEEILIVDQVTGAVTRRFPLTAAFDQSGGNLQLADGYLVVAQPDRIAVFADVPEMRKQSLPDGVPPSKRPIARPSFFLGRIEAAEQHWEVAAEQYHLVNEFAEPQDQWNGRALRQVAAEREFDARLKLARLAFESREVPPDVLDLMDRAIESAPDRIRRGLALATAIRWCQMIQNDHWHQYARRAVDNPDLANLRLRFAREGPVILHDWVQQQLDRRPVQPQAGNAKATDERDSNTRASAAKLRIPIQPDNQAPGTKIATPRNLESATSTRSDLRLNWPLHRRWNRPLTGDVHLIAPLRQRTSGTAGYILTDRNPVSCLAADSGLPLWQLKLSHPLLWSAEHRDVLLLATCNELRAVDPTTGRSTWRFSLSPANVPVSDPNRIQLVSEIDPNHPQDVTPLAQVWDLPQLTTHDGHFSDFTLLNDTLLARHGNQRIVAWNVSSGTIQWCQELKKPLAQGIVAAVDQVFAMSGETLMTFDMTSGLKIGEWSTDTGPWQGSPLLRDDNSFLAVGLTGQLTSWSKPGPAWYTEEGPIAWKWTTPVSQTRIPAQVLGQGDVNLIVVDGDTLIAADAISGKTLWKTPLGRDFVSDAAASITLDQERVYLPSEGILRAYSLKTGTTVWETYIGNAKQPWQLCKIGEEIIACPTQSTSGSDIHIAVCNSTTGKLRQKLTLGNQTRSPAQTSVVKVQLIACGTKVLVKYGNQLTGLD